MRNKKTISSAFRTIFENTFEGVPHDLISIELVQETDKETGEIINVVKAEAEVQKGYDEFSRCRFFVKIAGSSLAVTNKQVNESDYEIKLKGLQITYIDSNENTYCKAKSYEVRKVE